MKLETSYEEGNIDVIVQHDDLTMPRVLLQYRDPLEALEDARNLTVAAAECLRYERARPDGEVRRDTYLIDARLHARSGDLYYTTRVPRDPAPRLVELDGRTFELDMPNVLNLRGLSSCAYREVEVYGAQERGSGGTLG